ncbi:MAG: GSCFA domain-containing protein [Saprospiraceae bacterium]|nr:GSCFA domain-containing protein [Saprospiraceae bacterium]
MKSFRTVLPTPRAPLALTHADRLLLLGSCFTEHIGARLQAGKFSTLVNPQGIVYNPVSMARSLENLLWGEFSIRPTGGRIENSPYIELNGLWHSWEHHGVFSKPERADLLQGMAAAQAEAQAFLQKTSCLLLTLGTADVFVLRSTGVVVANCHKAPASWFEQRRLSVAETTDVLANVLQPLKKLLPGLQVILTVSPVRHLRNGFVDNQRSKAVLTLAAAALCDTLPDVHYFPAYELLLDDLRDYRFYAADMVHPNETAIDYIWEYFVETWFPADTRERLRQIEKILAALRHRPFNPDTAQHRAFAARQLEAIQALETACPEIRLDDEKKYFLSFSG